MAITNNLLTLPQGWSVQQGRRIAFAALIVVELLLDFTGMNLVQTQAVGDHREIVSDVKVARFRNEIVGFPCPMTMRKALTT